MDVLEFSTIHTVFKLKSGGDCKELEQFLMAIEFRWTFIGNEPGENKHL